MTIANAPIPINAKTPGSGTGLNAGAARTGALVNAKVENVIIFFICNTPSFCYL